MKRHWLSLIFEDNEDREWQRDHQELNPDAAYYGMPPAVGVLSLSFSLGWAWKGLPGAVLCFAFLGIPATVAAIYFSGKAANEYWDDEPALRRWRWGGYAVFFAAIFA